MRQIAKNILFVTAVVVTVPLWGCHKLFFQPTKQEGWFLACAQLMSLFPGKLGVVLRRGFYAMTLDNCARDCSIEFGTWFSHPQAIIEPDVYIGSRCSVGMTHIGTGTLIGSNVDLLSGRQQHGHADSEQPMRTQAGSYHMVTVGAGCWIGNSAVVMADIGENSIVGAGSVVVKAIPANSVAVGNPAEVIRSR